MGAVVIMATELDHLSMVIGGLQTKIDILTQTVMDNHETSTEEHRKVHDIVVAASEAVRNLTRIVAEMKLLTDDYRETRAERRSAKRVVTFLYVTVGGIAGAFASKIVDFFTMKPHP